MITRELVGVSRSDASIAPAGVGGRLEAWIACGNKVNIWVTTKRRGVVVVCQNNIWPYSDLRDSVNQYQ